MTRTTGWAKGAAMVATAVALATVPTAAAIAKPPVGQTTTSFAGYQVSNLAKPVTSATVTFVIPTITCKKNFSGVGPSVAVASAPSQKTGIERFAAAGVGVQCQNKTAAYQSIVQFGSKFYDADVPLSVGDTITVTIKVTKKKASVKVVDGTTKAQKTRTAKGYVGATAQIGNHSLTINKAGVGLDPFGKTSFTGAEVNGKSLATQKAVQLTWVRHKTVLAQASKLSKGKNFTVSFKHS